MHVRLHRILRWLSGLCLGELAAERVPAEWKGNVDATAIRLFWSMRRGVRSCDSVRSSTGSATGLLGSRIYMFYIQLVTLRSSKSNVQ